MVVYRLLIYTHAVGVYCLQKYLFALISTNLIIIDLYNLANYKLNANESNASLIKSFKPIN